MQEEVGRVPKHVNVGQVLVTLENFESAVITAQNDECKGSLHSLNSRLINIKT